MFLNLAAAWKDLAHHLGQDDPPEDYIQTCRRAFYTGAGAMMMVQTNIVSEHEAKHARILLKALSDEVDAFLQETVAEA